MSRQIWKYPISLSDGGKLSGTFPARARPLYFGLQDDTPTLWMEVQLGEFPNTERAFEIIGTGHPISEDAKYIGTLMMPPFVWHLYEVTA